MAQLVRSTQMEPDLPLEDRIMRLMQHLGIEQAHFAAQTLADWQPLARKYPDVIASLTLVCPASLTADWRQPIASRTLVVFGERSPHAGALSDILASVPEARKVILTDYTGLGWDDIAADRTEEVGSAMLDFLKTATSVQSIQRHARVEAACEVAGIPYATAGAGEPLILFPLFLAPSQWTPLLPSLSEHYCTFVLTGPELGGVSALEDRGRARGYRRLLGNMMDEIQIRPGEAILEVGCGTGVIDRWLARRTNGANRIVGVDINRFLLQEAQALAKKKGLEHTIEFKHGNAEDLPFPDASFDVTISSTVMEEVDADKMLAEMIRVTRPGGRIGIIVRATDVPFQFNLPIGKDLRAKANGPVPDEGRGCATVTLYQRIQRSVLTNITMMPQFAVFDNPDGPMEKFYLGLAVTRLNQEETKEWDAAVAKAAAEKTFLFAQPHHCVVGTKPR